MTTEELKAEDPPPVRLSGKWMSVWDDRILEYINAKGHGTGAQLARSGYVRVTRQHVNRRLNLLADHGLLEPLGNGVFVITDRGRKYLNGKFDAAEDRPDEPSGPAVDPDEDDVPE